MMELKNQIEKGMNRMNEELEKFLQFIYWLLHRDDRK